MILRPHPFIKICCIGSVEEAHLAIRYGASALGLVSAMPSGPGVIDEAQIRTIAQAVPPPIATFLLTASQDADHIIEQQRYCSTNTIQLVDSVSMAAYAKLRAALLGIALVQAIHVVGEDAYDEALAVAPHVDALLLDSGNPNLSTKVLGGTGLTHNWAISRRIVQDAPVPVFLAGGLRAHNVGDAFRAVRPHGLDLCTGVRTEGRLDEEKLAAFFEAVHAATKLPTAPD